MTLMVRVLHNAELAGIAPSILRLPVLQRGFAGGSFLVGQPSLGSPALFTGRVACSVRVCTVQFVSM